MINYIHSLRTTLALLIVAMTVTIGAGLSTSAHAAKNGINKPPQVNEQEKVKIRKDEERALRVRDGSHAKHADSLAKQYLQTAKIVKKQGGDPKPLYAAAAYFRNQAK